MKFQLPASVTRKVSRQILIGRKHSPAILFGVGIVGVVTTTVTASRATLKLESVLDAAQHDRDRAAETLALGRADYTESDYKKDMTVLYVRNATALCKLYGPSVLLGVLSIAALAGSHNILSKRNAGLTAAYAVLERGFSDYRGRVVDEYGEEKDRELRFGKETHTVVTEDKNGPKKQEVTSIGGSGASRYATLFDDNNENWSPTPEYNVMFLRGVQNQSTNRLRAKGHLFLNDVLDDLGFDRTPAGSQVGWLWGKGDKDGDGCVDFGIFNDDSLSRFHDFVTGREGGVWLDFNVDGVMWESI